MWEIYDALIDAIDRDIVVEQMITSRRCAFVKSGAGVGLGMSHGLETRPAIMTGDIIGKPLYKIAALVKSWNILEASVGQAAINAYYNCVQTACANGINVSAGKYVEDRMSNPFISYQAQVRGATVGVVGHFNYLKQLFAPVCRLHIFERDDIEGDYPFEATEVLLPQCDYVFISSNALSEKTLPRLLELSENAFVTMVGPTTPMSPILFNFGIDDLSGFVVKDSELAFKFAAGSKQTRIYKSGQKVSLKRSEQEGEFLRGEREFPMVQGGF